MKIIILKINLRVYLLINFLSLQEVKAQPQNLLANFVRTEPWTKKFKEVLKRRDYVVIKSENLQGLLLVIFAQRKHVLHIRNVETETTKTGFGGLWVRRLC